MAKALHVGKVTSRVLLLKQFENTLVIQTTDSLAKGSGLSIHQASATLRQMWREGLVRCIKYGDFNEDQWRITEAGLDFVAAKLTYMRLPAGYHLAKDES